MIDLLKEIIEEFKKEDLLPVISLMLLGKHEYTLPGYYEGYSIIEHLEKLRFKTDKFYNDYDYYQLTIRW